MYIFYRNIIVLLALFISQQISAQTNLSGTINQYTKVLSFDATQNMVNVSGSTGFKVCDTVLIIQMKGASINTENSAVYGSINSLNNAGNHEKAIISNIVGSNIFFRYQLLNTYNPSLAVQLVTLPQYRDVNITGQLTGKAWDGESGGIIAFEASGIVRITGTIDATGIGFRGGNTSSNSSCITNITDFTVNSSGLTATKGESIAIIDAIAGKGGAANGGGAGLCLNGGGGGGSNAGAGGIGGKSPQLAGGSADVSGLGGRFLGYTSSSTRIFLGGGGGGGHQNDTQATTGGNGGGLVYIKGSQIIGGGTITANGQNAAQAGIDGAGGGGGGGTVVLNATVKPLKINIQIKGGNGGNTVFSSADCFAPGGGGGGGIVLSNGSIEGITASLEGGLAGKVVSASSPCNNATHGATTGQEGIAIVNNNIMPFTITTITNPITATITTTAAACGDANQLLTVNTTTGATYQWQRNGVDIAGQTSTTFTATTSGVYRVKVTLGCNSIFSSDITVTLSGQPAAVILSGTNVSICNITGSSATLVAASATGYTYQWRKDGVDIMGATNNTLNVNVAGSYDVKVSACTNTVISSATTVTTISTPDITLTGSANIICTNGSVLLTALPKEGSYEWYHNGVLIPNFFNSTYETTKAGIYRVVSRFACTPKNSLDFTITQVNGITLATITGQGKVCRNKTTLLRASAGSQYQWLINNTIIAGATSNTLQTGNVGSYTVRISDACGNSVTSAPFSVEIVPPPTDILIQGNNLLCNGQAILSTTVRKNSTYTYQWLRNLAEISGATDTSLVATAVGIYNLRVKDTCGTVYESPNFVVAPNPVSSISIVSSRTVICPDEKVTLTATANNNTTDLQWQLNGNDITGAIGITYQAIQAGNYSVRTRYICNNFISTPYALQAATPPQVTIGGNPIFCIGDNTILTANVTNGGNAPRYQWFRDSQAIIGAITQSIPVSTVGIYTVQVTNGQGCNAISANLEITSSKIDETKVQVTPSRLVCSGNRIQLSATGGTKYEWSPTTGLNNPFIDNPTATITQTTIYKVKVMNNVGCFVERFVTLEAVPNFTLDFDIKYSSECGKKALVEIINKSEGLNGFNEIKWDMGDGTTLTGFSPVPYIYEKGSTYTITMTVNNRGCVKNITKTVTVESLFTPNVITPNNDGKNDKFVIDNPNEKWKLEIFNRYGKKVYESDNYNNDWAGEDRTIMYFYKLVSPTGRECMGWIQVLNE